MPPHPDPLSYFRLKPIQIARVSEISEITAASPVPPEERVNFHIGNPLQDERLSSAFLRISLGLDVRQEELLDSDPAKLMDALGWPASEQPKLDALIRVIQKSSPYAPRGGFSRKNPHSLINAFSTWLEQQQEPLIYDKGEKTGRREIILASGGTSETLRIFFFAFASYLQILPATILTYGYELPAPLKAIPHLDFIELSAEDETACDQIEQFIVVDHSKPAFLVMGKIFSEETRRKLRRLSLEYPLFFIEANDAPNHLSLAREARLVQRVIRLLTPAIFNPRWHGLSTILLAGNADFLNVLENVHFSMKGTPSASEVELLTYLLEHGTRHPLLDTAPVQADIKPVFEGFGLDDIADASFAALANRAEKILDDVIERHVERASHLMDSFEQESIKWMDRIPARLSNQAMDEFGAIAANDLLGAMDEHIDQPTWVEALQRSFLFSFAKQQPQYKAEACRVVSGSSRTALGILGFHCGITEVVIADLSWSYEQCFPVVHAVPLTESLGLDVKRMIQKVDDLLRSDPTWRERGAVAINNPHNATGKILNEQAVRELTFFCLQKGLVVIDDLAYQNVAPVDDLPLIKTIRQLTDEMVLLGEVTEEQASRVITIHSMSKTDCLAGARMAVAEIRDDAIRQRFDEVNKIIEPNLAAILICYLFYRGPKEAPHYYWLLRNRIFKERTQALIQAASNLSPERNPYGLTIIPPTGSMYPLLTIKRLPGGLSLDWLASSLARRGTGLLPLSTFARTEDGFDVGRETFRLTLGGVDNADVLLAKTRRLLIDLNRLIQEEDARYNRKALLFTKQVQQPARINDLLRQWSLAAKEILNPAWVDGLVHELPPAAPFDPLRTKNAFLHDYAPARLDVLLKRLVDRASISDEWMRRAQGDPGGWLESRLEREFMKDSLARRQELFCQRSYDRTVHPTQMYSIQAEMTLDRVVNALIHCELVNSTLLKRSVRELWQEFLGRNVSINSEQEADEILLDLDALVSSENYAEQWTDMPSTSFLSFWSDWDGSNRPSGQGHRLVAAVVMENVRRMGRILNLLLEADPKTKVAPELLDQLSHLPQQNQNFLRLLNDITSLTHQLEQRYRGILPFSIDTTPMQRLATSLHIRRDPARILWQHNDRYEKKMLDLRRQRREMLEYYCDLNKRLRKQLHGLIPAIQNNYSSDRLLREVVGYQDILQRTVITPRIHQSMITARDQFAIDTTVFNIYEINTITGKYGNPGIALAMQVSFSNNAEVLVALDRKMHHQTEQMRRENPTVDLPQIWLIPLFEEVDSVRNIRGYLDRVWEYAIQSRQASQSAPDRFAEIIPEVFIAGSDLSQQVSQAAGASNFLRAKYDIQSWLAEHGALESLRVKFGSGEPMQRQGGYYSDVSGQPAFIPSEANQRRFVAHLPAAAHKSTAYATTPLQGVFLSPDLRTFQSNLSEQLRYLPVRDYAELQYHVRESQKEHRADLIRAAESIAESRMSKQSRNVQELERLTMGVHEAFYDDFLAEMTSNFRQILYGRVEDVVGLHIISYFIGRSIPQLRDRPTSRRVASSGIDRGQQILANIAKIIPLEKQGSLLRAIAHNQAQTTVLGINQLTTGLFRALERYVESAAETAEWERMVTEHILPHLPVYEILSTLRVYQDVQGEFLRRIENAFPAGNSAFTALREDQNAMQRFLPLLQQELLRRHGVNVSDFFKDGRFIQDLLPTVRPDLAVLLQEDIFNRDCEVLLAHTSGRVEEEWTVEVKKLLHIPGEVQSWRSIIWDVIGESLYQRVQSFSELATALYAFSSNGAFGPAPVVRGPRLSASLTGFFRTARADDEMRNFLVDAVDYLRSYAEGNIEVPVSIIRALNDVERIAQIEETSLPAASQDVLRCCLLQIARLTGENG